MNSAESFASVMLANFEASRLEQISMLVESTNSDQYRQFVETKNNPRISQFLKDSGNILISEEHKSFSNALSNESEEDRKRILHDISLLDSRKEIDEYIISHFASLELQNEVKNIFSENLELSQEIIVTRQKLRGK